VCVCKSAENISHWSFRCVPCGSYCLDIMQNWCCLDFIWFLFFVLCNYLLNCVFQFWSMFLFLTFMYTVAGVGLHEWHFMLTCYEFWRWIVMSEHLMGLLYYCYCSVAVLLRKLAMQWLKWLIASLRVRRPWFDPRAVHVGFMVDKLAWGQVSIHLVWLYAFSISPPM